LSEDKRAALQKLRKIIQQGNHPLSTGQAAAGRPRAEAGQSADRGERRLMYEAMAIRRREFLAAGAATVASIGAARWAFAHQGADMFGMIGKMTTVPGKRDELIAILLAGVGEMPGCLSYIVATDPGDANAIWITEAWDSKASHDASLSLPGVKDAISKGRPMIAGFSDGVVTTPVGGHGLTAP
jgi:quinol monooxygenase YgiN